MPDIKSPITFEESAHVYTSNIDGSELISATTLLEEYKPKFDSEYHAARVAKREGVSVDVVLASWNKLKDDACEFGSDVHVACEEFLLTGVKRSEYLNLIDSFDRVSKPLISHGKTIYAEKLMWDLDLRIAGTADIVVENKDTFVVGDFKTNKRFRFKSKYKEYYLDPISHLAVCEFNSYALQMSLYAFLYEKMTNKKCAALTVYYKQGQQFLPINCNYLKHEIEAMVDSYTKKGTKI